MLIPDYALKLCVILILITPVIAYSLRRFYPRHMGKFNSIAGGFGIVTIIAAMIPGIVERIPDIIKASDWPYLTTYPRVAYVLLVSILVGFFIMYILEKLAYEKVKRGLDPSNITFISHLMCLCLVLFASTAAIPAIAENGFIALYLFTLLLCFEIFLEENALIRHYKKRFNHWIRALLIGFGVLGYGSGSIYEPHLSTLTYSCLEGIIIGILLVAIIKTEFDLLEERSHFPTFIISAVFKILFLFLLFFIF